MSRYRKTMSEAMAEVNLNEVGYLQSRLNDTQIKNIKNLWKHKTKSDVTPAVKKMIANMDVPTQLAIKHAGINQLSDLVEGRMSDIDAMRKQGASAAKIAKELGIDVKTVKAILGESEGDSAQDMQDAQAKAKTDKIKETVETWEEAVKKKEKTDVAPENDVPVEVKEEELEEAKFTINYDVDSSSGADNRYVGQGKEMNINAFSPKDAAKKFGQALNKIVKQAQARGSRSVLDVSMNGIEKDGNYISDREVDKLNDYAGDFIYKESLEEAENGEVEKLKKELEKSREQTVAVKQKAQTDAQKQAQRARTAQDKMVNPETGEPLLQVGIAYKHLKQKMEKEKEEQEAKKRSDMIAQVGKDKPKLNDEEEEMTESAASDKAKGMGLDYMKFGRYGKDGKVTHKTSGDNLVKVGKDDEPKSDTPAPKKPEAPKKDKPKEADDTQIKSRNFLKDLDNGDLEDEDGNPIELDFDDEFSFDAAIEKCREMGLDDLADELGYVGSDVAEAEPDKAEAAFQDLMAKFSGKKLASLEKMKVADKQIDLFNDQAYGDTPQQTSKNMGPLIKDGTATLKTIVDMVNADKTEGSPGSGMSNAKKGFRPEVIETLQNLEDMANSLLSVADETKDEKMKEKLEMIAGELEFCYDENADHDNYTKSHKCNSSLEAALDMFKDLSKMTRKNEDKLGYVGRLILEKKYKNEEVISEAGITPQMIATLKKEYEPFRNKKITAARAKQLMNILDKFKEADLQKLGKENIPFISSGSRSKLAVRNMKFTVKNIQFGEEMDEEMFEACWTGYKQVGMKDKGGKQVPNCVPEETLVEFTSQQIKQAYGIANDPRYKQGNYTGAVKAIEKLAKGLSKHPDVQKVLKRTNEDLNEFKKMTITFKSMDDMSKASTDLAKQGFTINAKGTVMKVDGKGADLNKYAHDLKNFYGAKVKAENAPAVADMDRLKKQGMKPKMKNEEHPARAVFEQIAGLKNKAEKSGMPYGILKKVYDRGMAAWRGGHRPGATQQQWAFARVNSFVTKSSGTWGGADKDLAKQVKGK